MFLLKYVSWFWKKYGRKWQMLIGFGLETYKDNALLTNTTHFSGYFSKRKRANTNHKLDFCIPLLWVVKFSKRKNVLDIDLYFSDRLPQTARHCLLNPHSDMPAGIPRKSIDKLHHFPVLFYLFIFLCKWLKKMIDTNKFVEFYLEVKQVRFWGKWIYLFQEK